VNYEVSETQREVLRAPGAVKRITVAVLVDGVRGTDASGVESWQARPEEELAALRELVASAVGLDEARGDVITIKSMPFEAAVLLGTEAGATMLAGVDLMSAAQLGVLAVVALILGLFVVRPILVPQEAPALAGPSRRELAGPGGGGGGAMEIGRALPGVEGAEGGGAPVFTGEIDDDSDYFAGGFPQVNPSLPAPRGKGEGEANFDPNDPVARLRRLIAERQDETAEILRSWMDDRGEKV
jgi:flagellar M-ring protein FliF